MIPLDAPKIKGQHQHCSTPKDRTKSVTSLINTFNCVSFESLKQTPIPKPFLRNAF